MWKFRKFKYMEHGYDSIEKKDVLRGRVFSKA